MARAYALVRDGILAGRYGWGERLGETTLAAELGVSRTPVREALRNLAADGFIELRPHAGATVRTWDAGEIRSSFDIRAEIEGAAAAKAASRITHSEISELTELCDRMEAARLGRDARDSASRSALNRSFHTGILRISGVSHAEKIAMQLADLAVVTMTYRQFSDRDTSRSDSDHRLLLRAFRLRDEALAQAVMRTHILTAAAVLDSLQAQEKP